MASSSDLHEILCLLGGFAPTTNNINLIESRLDAHLANLNEEREQRVQLLHSRKDVGEPQKDHQAIVLDITPATFISPHRLNRGGTATTTSSPSTSSKLSSSATPAAREGEMKSSPDEDTLREMIHLSTGLMPGTNITNEVMSSRSIPRRESLPLSDSSSLSSSPSAQRNAETTNSRSTGRANTTASATNSGYKIDVAFNEDHDEDADEMSASHPCDETLREMIHLATGLPISSRTTQGIFATTNMMDKNEARNDNEVDDGERKRSRSQHQTSNRRSNSNRPHLPSSLLHSDSTYDQTLREMIYMSTGLPISTAVGSHRMLLGGRGNGQSESDGGHQSEIVPIRGLFYYLNRNRLNLVGNLRTPQTSSNPPAADHLVSTSATARAAEEESSAVKYSTSIPTSMINSAVKSIANVFYHPTPTTPSGQSAPSTSAERGVSSNASAATRRAARRERAKASSGIPEELLGF